MRLRQLTEAECYARCYGASEGGVRVIRLQARPPRFPTELDGEALRQLFEARLDGREPPEEMEAA